MEKTKKKRNGFASGIGFILAAAGSAVGLGNLWSFPYKTSANGGAAFVFIYILSVIVIGSIVMISEIYLGKRAQANPVTAYSKTNKNMGWLGLFAIIIPFLIITYYGVLGGYTVKYSLNSFSGNAGILGTFSVNIGEVILYTVLFMVLALIIVMAGVKGGIEKASKVLMPVLFCILVGVVIYSLCLGEGVAEGLNFYLNPNFGELGLNGILFAMSQAFFSLSLGMGIMVSYGSYTGKKVKVGNSVVMICIFDSLVALLAGLAIFPAVAHFDSSLLGDKAKGIGLMFSILPSVFDSMGTIGSIISFFFFTMVAIAALTSVISLVEVVTQFAIQKFKLNRKKCSLIIICLCTLISIPVGISLGKVGIMEESGLNLFGFDVLTFLDETTNAVLMPICALGSCIALGWFIEKGSFKSRLNPMNTYKTLEEDGLNLGKFGKIFAVMVKYITPLFIAVVEIGGIIVQFNDYAKKGLNYLPIVIFALILLIIPIVLYFTVLKNKNNGCNSDEIDIAIAAVLPEDEFVCEE